MIRYLTLIEVLELHRRILEQSGGALVFEIWACWNQQLPSLE